MAKKTSRFGSNVTDNVDKRKREGSSYGYLKLPQGVNIYKESAGKHQMDVIPYIVTDENHMDGDPKFPDAANPGNPWYKKPILVHRNIGAENESVVCPKTIGKKCPVCEARGKQQSQGLDKDTGLIDKAQLRNLYVIIPIGHKEYEEKFHIWDISNGNFQKKLDEELSDNKENGVFPDPETGKTLSARFTEKTFAKNKYFECTRIDFEDRDAYEEDIMEKAPNLDELITILPYKELEKMFLEIGDDDEDEKEPAPKRKAKEEEEEDNQPRRKKTVKEEPAPAEEEEEEEEQPAPRRKTAPESSSPFKRKTATKPDPKEEEEEEEEEETPAPAPKRKAKEEEAPAPRRKNLAAAETATGTCPSKHKFGEDWDGYDDCDDCPVFKACGVAHAKK